MAFLMGKAMPQRVKIVYFTWINPQARWDQIIAGQLDQLKKTGLLEVSEFHAHIVATGAYLHLVTSLVASIIPNAIISTSENNEYEYRGIHRVWKLAQDSVQPDDIYLYFHSKGMSYNRGRDLLERLIFQEVIEAWKQCLEIFATRSDINKIGHAASEQGYVWWNFWWVRGSYLRECVEPIINSNRYYYEEWLHLKLPHYKPSTYRECYSLAGQSSERAYTSPNAVAAMQQVIERYYRSL